MPELDIGEVVRRSGLAASTLRFYEERSLIRSVGRAGLRRQYDSSVLDRLALIALGRAAGFSLVEIATMFATDGPPQIDRQLLLARANALDRQIARLVAMREGLRHAAVCRAASHADCPRFRRLLKAALAGKLDGRTRQASVRHPPDD